MTAEPVVTGETAVKTAWIPSDAPKNADLSATGSPPSRIGLVCRGSERYDEDLLSSISSDVKRVEKERSSQSLIKLKELRAPASDMRANSMTCTRKKLNPANPPKGKDHASHQKIK